MNAAPGPRREAEAAPPPTAVYVHFPYCERKCPYCDFASLPAEPARIPAVDYTDRVLRELELRAGALAGRRLQSIFVGGGTPSLWAPRQLGRLLRALRGAFEEQEETLEVTVECNPRSLPPARAEALREAGVNRFSVGVQSLHAEGLRFLGRLHDGAEALAAVRGAAATGARVSADLIFGWPRLRAEALLQDAERLLEAGARHLSAYALTIEPGTRFGELHRQGRLPTAPEEEVARQYEALGERLAALGLRHYEVSNWAAPAEEARHNQHVWRGGDYLGLGAGAVGCLSRPGRRARRHRNHPLPGRYGAGLDEGDPGGGAPRGPDGALPWEAEVEWLDPAERLREAWMLGLRTAEGLDLDATGRRLGLDPLEGRREAVARLAERGMLRLEGGVARVPEERWLLLDGIVLELF